MKYIIKTYTNKGEIILDFTMGSGTTGVAVEELNRDEDLDLSFYGIELDDKYAKAYYNRGNLYGKLDKLNEALADYTKAIEINPKYTEAYYNRGNVYGRQGNHSQAIADYTKAIETNAQYAAAYGNRGLAYQSQGNLQQALADFNRAIEINPKYAAAYANRGNVYQIQGNLQQAITDYNKAIEINPDIAGFYSNRGNAYQAQGKLDFAIEDYNKAIEKNPKDSACYYNRGLAYYSSEQYDKSLADYKVAVNQEPSKEAYNEFIKYFPAKKTTDKNDVRNQIVLLFEGKFNPAKKTDITEAVAAPVVAAAPARVNAKEDIKNMVNKWVNSWESGDMKTYRNSYADNFTSKGMNLNEWVTYKTNIREKSKNVKISIDDLKISEKGDAATAVFTQSYSSSILQDKGKKTLELKKINNEWKIYKELM